MTGPLVEASPADAATLADLHALAVPRGEQWSAEAVATQLALAGVFALLWPGAGFVLGRIAADEAEILTIAVVPAARRAGRGAALLHAAEARARAAGARTMFLEVATDNYAARALYRSAGYVQVGLRPHYYPDGADALVLARPLSAVAAKAG